MTTCERCRGLGVLLTKNTRGGQDLMGCPCDCRLNPENKKVLMTRLVAKILEVEDRLDAAPKPKRRTKAARGTATYTER